MANKSLFASAVATLLPRADAVNREGAPAYAYGPEAKLAQLAATGTLADNFYGAADAKHARVRDPSVFPLLATLHYLVRANGCIRVLETGTARGVSAACLATAVVAWLATGGDSGTLAARRSS